MVPYFACHESSWQVNTRARIRSRATYVCNDQLHRKNAVEKLSDRSSAENLTDAFQNQGRIYCETNESETTGPFTWTRPFKGPGIVLAVPKKFSGILQLIYEINLIEFFSDLTKILKLFLKLPLTSCEAEITFSKLLIVIYQIMITHERAKTELYFFSLKRKW